MVLVIHKYLYIYVTLNSFQGLSSSYEELPRFFRDY
jgi:hypothetical protein